MAKNTPSNLRRAAAQALAAIERGAMLDKAASQFAALPPADRRFAHLLLLTALRRRGEIAAQLASYIEKPIPPRPHLARALLHIGVAQLVYLGTPPHAAINETLAAMAGREKPYRGLANAVLRKIAAAPPPPPRPQENLPDWLAARWRAHYGDAACAAMAALLIAAPPLDLQFATPQAARTWLAAHGDTLAAKPLTAHAVRVQRAGNVEALPDYAAGTWWVQDIAASMAAPLLDAQDGEAVLDVCAAPGGKTLQLAAQGARVTALDNSAARLAVLRANLQRTQMAAEIIHADFTTWQSRQSWPAILLDAPCSATGTLRRNPDIALHRRAADIAARAALQSRLLDRAASLLAPNGRLVYCVCSLEPEEGEAQVEGFLARHKNMRVQETRRTRPDQYDGGCDGFFMALFS